jgi:trimeric autotransporter adhesin
LVAAGACAGGVICAGAAGRGFAGGFLAAASAGAVDAVDAAVDAGRGAGTGAVATAAGARGAGAAAAAGGSGVMMLTGGIEAEVGNSALVGLPVGIDGGSAATGPAAAGAGAFHDGA